MIITLVAAAVLLVALIAVFVVAKKSDKDHIDRLIQSGALKDQTLKDDEERLKKLMEKIKTIDGENSKLRDDNKSLLNVINALLTVSPRYVLQAFADKKLFDLVQKEILVEKKVPFKLDVKYVAERTINRLAG